MEGVILLNNESYQRKEIEKTRKVKKNCDTIFRSCLKNKTCIKNLKMIK